MSALAGSSPLERHAVQIAEFGELSAISRLGGQGRVYRPAQLPELLGAGPAVVKLYRRPPSAAAARVLSAMVEWGRSLVFEERVRLHRVAAWPMAIAYSGLMPVGIAMQDLSGPFAVPFVMPSGRREHVLLALEHLLGDDGYLQARGLGVRLDTVMRTQVAEAVSGALGCLHRHGIVVGDIAPSNLLVAFGAGTPIACFIDCDSMVFRGREALAAVETGDWNMPASFAEAPCTRAADSYKLGLVVLRLFARSHDARDPGPSLAQVPLELRALLARALDRDVANRPPAGEWERALHQLRGMVGLNERYPAPASRPRAARPPVTPVRPSDRASRPRPPVAAGPRRAPLLAAVPAAGPAWLRPAVVALWLIAGTAVLALILSRMFAAALPNQSTPAPQPVPRATYQYNPSAAAPSATDQGRQFP